MVLTRKAASRTEAARNRVLLFLCLLAVLVTPFGSSRAAEGERTVGYNIFLTNKTENNRPLDEPINQFDCSDRIHVVILAAGLTKEKHELKVRWLDPVGNQKEVTRYKFDGLPVTKIWAWLQLDGGTAAIVGQMFDPSFGMEEFIGEWISEIFIDDEKVAEKTFQVLC